MIDCTEREALSYSIIELVVWLRPKLSIADVNNEGIVWTIEANMVWEPAICFLGTGYI